MKISDLLRWGPRKPASPAIRQEAPPPRQERRLSDRRNIQGTAQLWWVGASGDIVRADGTFTDSGDEGVGADLDKPAPVGTAAWFTFDSEQPWPSIIKHSEVNGEKFHVGAAVEQVAATAPHDSCSVELEWFSSDGVLHSGGANVRSGKEGCLELDSDSAVPAREIVLVKGAEVCCLAVTARSEARGDRHFVEVEVLTEASPKYSARAAQASSA